MGEGIGCNHTPAWLWYVRGRCFVALCVVAQPRRSCPLGAFQANEDL